MGCYILPCKIGCNWRMLPNDFPKWQLVYYYYRKWVDLENIVERNFAWFENDKRLCRNYKLTLDFVEEIVKITKIFIVNKF